MSASSADTERRENLALRLLSKAGADLSSSLDSQSVLDRVVHLAVPDLADICTVRTLRPDGRLDLLAVATADTAHEALVWQTQEKNPLFIDRWPRLTEIMQTGRAVVDIEGSQPRESPVLRDHPGLWHLRILGVESTMSVPLLARGRVLGVMSFIITHPGRRYDAQDLALAEALAGRCAMAIDNADLFRREQQARQAAERSAAMTARMQAITAALSEAATPQQVAEVVVREGAAATSAHAGMMYTMDPQKGVPLPLGLHGYPQVFWREIDRTPLLAEGLAGDAVRSGEPIWLRTADEYRARYPLLSQGTLPLTRTRALCCVPCFVGSRAIGGLILSFPEENPFGEEERAFILTLARQGAQALERARLYAAERDARAEAEKAVRLRDEFLSVAAHELKTPLTTLWTYAQLAMRQSQRGAMDAALFERAMNAIDVQSEKLSRLIGHLLDVSRLGAGKMVLNRQVEDLVPLVKTLVAHARERSADRDIALDAPVAAAMFCDALRLEQAMTNLLDNAVKFSPDGSPIEVELCQPAADHFRVSVTDHGIGIPVEHRAHIFDRFYQAHADSFISGMGLGLWISHEIIALHGGRLAVEFPDGGGTRFVLTLPAGGPEGNTS